jgi:ferritin-like metal-binding protein YciE
MALNELRDLYVHELRDLYNAEKQITKALPKMIKAANHDELRSAFEEHLEVTREQMSRLEQIFEAMGERSAGPKCKGMEGLIEENKEMMEEDASPSVCDAALIVGAQKVEHYEIAGLRQRPHLRGDAGGDSGGPHARAHPAGGGGDGPQAHRDRQDDQRGGPGGRGPGGGRGGRGRQRGHASPRSRLDGLRGGSSRSRSGSRTGAGSRSRR